MRRVLTFTLLLALVVFAAGASSAHAGLYTISGCNDIRGSDGWGPEGSYYVGGYPDCSVRSNGGAPALSTARVMFTAPSGTAIVAIRGTFNSTQQGGWQVGIYDFDDPGNRRWLWCGPNTSCTSFGTSPAFAADQFRTTRLGVFQICGASQCGGSSGFRASNVILTLDDYVSPNLSATTPSGWVRGTQGIANDANDNTGIRILQFLVDGMRKDQVVRSCSGDLRVPCPNGGAPLSLNTTTLADGRHAVRVEAFDAAGNGVGVDRSVAVDNTPPDPVSDLVVEGGDGWRSTSRFDLSWVSPEQSAAPLDAVELELCSAVKKPGDPECRHSSRPAADFASALADGRSVLKGVEVPKAGDWTAHLWLRDQAGNQTVQTARTVALRYDPVPPTAAFRPLDPGDPTRVRVAARDATSGIAAAQIEFQRRGETTWRALDTQLEDGGFAASLDDVNLPDGTYNLRARAVDRAGNERSTDRYDTGGVAELGLPVRIKTRLAVGKPRKVRIRNRPKGSRRRYRTRLIARPKVRYGPAVRLQGRLTTLGANPLSSTEVQVFAQPQVGGQTPLQIGTVTTSKTGRFSYRVAKGPSRIVSFRYAGTKTIRADSADVDLRVRAFTSFRPSRRSLRNGETVTFRGQLRGGWIPAQGKLVALQVRARGSWRPFATTRAGQDGRWSYRYRFDGTRGKVRYRFRARVLAEATYPYIAGGSGPRRVLVRGTR
jgi:hypothetical protein